MKVSVFGFLASFCVLALTACFGLDKGADNFCGGDGYYTACSRYGNVTECTGAPEQGNFNCVTRNECVDYSYCCYNNSCAGEGCLNACQGGVHSGGFVQELASSKSGIPVKSTDISMDKLLTAIPNGDIELLQSTGMSLGELIRSFKKQKPSDKLVHEFANYSGQSVEASGQYLISVFSKLRSAMKDENSAYWQTCIQSKQWVTDQNLSCRSTNWSGCSPDEGANYCMTKVGVSRLLIE